VKPNESEKECGLAGRKNPEKATQKKSKTSTTGGVGVTWAVEGNLGREVGRRGRRRAFEEI
jgi:hypothetical protein